MTTPQHREARRLIRSICSSCDNDNCIRLDTTCPQLHSASVSCRFFRNVLLKDAEAGTLEAEIFHPGNGKRCAVCGKLFYSTGNRAKYCADCKAERSESRRRNTPEGDGPASKNRAEKDQENQGFPAAKTGGVISRYSEGRKLQI